ncbi:MAG: glycosyltransferase family 2 protein [Bacteroidaceae bacterium]|nr:glycosyltransferase family 2 protein [Bacteroidaceae bacterium]
MLSVLIPTYNYDCTALAGELQRQIDAYGIVAEVIVMDDASTDMAVRQRNKAIDALRCCRLVELPENVGIARIRNLLAVAAKYDYMLFLDSDVFPVYDDFLQRYVDECHRADVLCGGLMFRAEPPRPECALRYKYGSRVESQSVEHRMQQPYGEFKTLNFFISRKAFMATRFNEDFVRYGHEDTLFGKELQQNGFSLLHIDNPIYHDVPDTNEAFLAKTRRSIENLCEHRDVLQSHVRLLAFYNRLQRLHLCGVVRFFFNIIERMLLANLTSSNPSLFVFNLYKVGYLCRKMRG